ncbi:MAG: GerMN domain-containing protein [Acidaminococcales bacterium]|jgi:spore germination protein GerM|nr:GerMN domain-containing protein [Acidaminococcales bacterium]
MTAGKTAAAAALGLWLLALAGCGFFGGSPGASSSGKEAQKEQITVTVYRPGQTGDLLYPEKYTMNKEPGVSPAAAAIGALLREKPQEESHVNIFPPGIRLVSLKVKGGLAEADFSKEMLKIGIGGSLYEMLLVSSIVNTLTEFPEITSVQLLVEGKKIDTIGGHMDIIDPLKRNASLIGKP